MLLQLARLNGGRFLTIRGNFMSKRYISRREMWRDIRKTFPMMKAIDVIASIRKTTETLKKYNIEVVL